MLDELIYKQKMSLIILAKENQSKHDSNAFT